MLLLLPKHGRSQGPDPDHGRCESLNTDAVFGTQRYLLALPDNAIAAYPIGNPKQAAQAGDFQLPSFQGQDLVVDHLDTLWTAKHG
jgi:hypothetical protein